MKVTSTANSTPVGIASVASVFPPGKILVEDVVQREKIANASKISAAIGIEQVHVFEGEWRSDLAFSAAEECMSRSGLKPEDIDMIIDFSVLPQDYVVPSWCMSNKIQHQLGARNAFNLGFGGGGPTNLLVAMRFASSLIKAEKNLTTALLIAADVAIPGNRIINADDPLTVLGDGASALIVTEGTGICEIIGTDLLSEGRRHDVLNVPGGGMAYPDRLDLYRLEVSPEKYQPEEALLKLKRSSERVRQLFGADLDEIAHFISPNISQKDQFRFADSFGLTTRDPYQENRKRYGHVQATDLVINLAQILENRGTRERELGLMCSHGWGFLTGTTLIKC